MARQGSQCQPKAFVRLFGYANRLCALSLCALLVSCMLPVVLCAQDAATPTLTDKAEVDANFQLSWNARQNQFWHVRLSIADQQEGTFSDLRNLCRSDLATGAFELSTDGKSVTFWPRFALPDGQLRIRYQGKADAKIIVDVRSGQQRIAPPAKSPDTISPAAISPATISPASKTQSDSRATAIAVSKLLSGARENQTLDESTNWSLQRLPNDAVQISLANSKLHVMPGKPVAFSIAARSLVGFANQTLSSHYDLVRVADGRIVYQDDHSLSIDQAGNSKNTAISIPTPDKSGAYEIRCRLRKSGQAWTRFGRDPETLASVAKTVVVLADPKRKRSKTETQPWRLLGKIQPAKRPEWELKKWLPGGNRNFASIGNPSRSGGLEQAKHNETVVSLLDPNGTYATALPKMRVGWPHRITLRYPSGQSLKLKVQIANSERFESISQNIELRESPHLGSKQSFNEQSFWHYPAASNEYIRLTNVTANEVLSFASIDVLGGPYRIESTEAAVDPKQRVAVLRLENFDWVNQLTTDQANRSLAEDYQPSSVELHRLHLATQRLQDYLKVAGYNAVSVPGNVQGNAWYSCSSFDSNQSLGDRRQHLSLFMQMMDTTDLKVFVGVDPQVLMTSVESALQSTNQSLAQWLRVRSKQIVTTQYNLLNQVVQSNLADWMQQIVAQLSVYRCYGGLVIHGGRDSHCEKLTASAIASEETLRAIYLSTAGNSPGQDLADKKTATPTSAQLLQWVQADGRETIQQWCDLQTTIARDQMTKADSGRTVFIGGLPNAAVGTKGFYNVADMRHGVSETAVVDADDVVGSDRGAIVGMASHADSIPVHSLSCVADLSHAIELVDPEILLFAEPKLTTAWHRELADAIRTFTLLPASPMQEVQSADPASKTACVRYGLRGGTTIVSIVNTAPWPSDIHMQFSGERPWRDVLADTKNQTSSETTPNNQTSADNPDQSSLGISANNWAANGTIIQASLEPGRTLVLASPVSDSNVVQMSWTSKVSGGADALKGIEKKVTTVVERIGSLSNPDSYFALTNGSFEQVGGVGIPGWMQKQHPVDAVQIDSHEAVDGTNSVLLKTDASNPGRTWIVSEQLRPPRSGRLAVSLACRGELVPGNTTTHKIKVSIEGTQSTIPIRHSQEFEVPRDGKWQPRVVVLEAMQIDPTTVDSIRLTIDSLSAGRVWIDDVHLHDRFSTTKERGDLQGEAFLAVQGLQHGNLTPAAQLLKNEWALQLLGRKPVKQVLTIEPNRSLPRRVEPPSVADRIKSWIPKPLRF